MSSAPALLEVQCLRKDYGTVAALDNVSFSVKEGEFACLLGPNGSGKSTLLKLLAGSEIETGGNLLYRGTPLNANKEAQKEFVMVWQSLALFPHMNVEDNVGYGLSVRKVSRKELVCKVEHILRKVGLTGYQRRKIHQLSGGEQQRVALARALVVNPSVLLLDEPFGAVDVQLRSQLQALLRDIHRTEGLTILMVTHDIPEALALAEKIIIMDRGRVQQIGNAHETVHCPANGMVARFVGHKNVFPGSIIQTGRELVTVRTSAGDFACIRGENSLEVGQEVAYIVDAAKTKIGGNGDNTMRALVESRFILGALTVTRAVVPGLGNVRCDSYNDQIMRLPSEDEVIIDWNTADATAIPLGRPVVFEQSVSASPVCRSGSHEVRPGKHVMRLLSK